MHKTDIPQKVLLKHLKQQMLSFLGKPEDSMQNNNKIDHLQNFIFDTNVILFKKANKKINLYALTTSSKTKYAHLPLSVPDALPTLF